MNSRIQNIILFGLIVLAITSILWWLGKDPTKSFAPRMPGMDNRGENSGEASEVINIGEHFAVYAELKSNLKESWPRFRGSDFDNISKSKVPLINSFEGKKPKILWSVDLGEGHAGPAIYKGAVYLMDYDEELRADMLRCFSLIDGKELWRRWYDINLKRNHGMSRTVPAVTEKYIVTIGPQAHVMCVDREDGNFRWGIDVEKEYSTEVPFWYTGQCPLIDDGKAIIATGGKALLIAVDCETGERLWETPNPNGWAMSHASIMPFTYNGIKMYVYSAVGGACGIAADGPDAGKILWETAAWNHKVVAPSAVCMPDGKIFLSAGYGAGSMLLQLTANGSRFDVGILQEYSPGEGLANEQQSSIYYQGHLFGIQPKDGGTLRNQLVCVDPGDCKKIIWSSGQTRRFGLGPYLIADNKLIILSDDATLTIVQPSIKEYIQLDQTKIFEGHDAWAPMAVADGYLLLRDSKKMVCLDIRRE